MTQWSLGSWIRCRHRRSFYRVGWIDSQSRGFYCCQGSIAFLWRKLDRSWQCPCLGRMASTKFYAFLLPLPVASSGSQCSPRLFLCRSQYSRNLWDEVWAISRDPGLRWFIREGWRRFLRHRRTWRSWPWWSRSCHCSIPRSWRRVSHQWQL